MNDLEQAEQLLKEKFGSGWRQIVQQLGTKELRERCGQELTSFILFPDRGQGGNNQWRGNCSPKVIEAVIQYILKCKQYSGKDTSQFTMIDPMSGSGSSQAAADKYNIQSYLYDLNPKPPHGAGNWNALKDEVEESGDFIFLHPPYHTIIPYSGNVWGKVHSDDLSRCDTYKDYIEKLNFVIKKLFFALRNDGRLAILVGDLRIKGNFYSIQHDIMKIGKFESFVVKGQVNCSSDNRNYHKPFIPVVTEYLLLYQKQDVFLVPFSYTQESVFDLSKRDTTALTWHHLIRMTMESFGGKASLQMLYEKLSMHPKALRNTHFKERIRATIYEHKKQYVPCGNGYYSLSYT